MEEGGMKDYITSEERVGSIEKGSTFLQDILMASVFCVLFYIYLYFLIGA